MPWLLILLLLGLAAGGAVVVLNTDWKDSDAAAQYLPLLNSVEQRFGIPHDLLARLAYQESAFRDDIISGQTSSSAGALGIMQLVPRFHPGVDPLDVPAAVSYAGSYLRAQFDRFRSWPLALAAYNAGPAVVADYLSGTNTSGRNPQGLRTGGIPPFPETQKYVRSITGDVGLA